MNPYINLFAGGADAVVGVSLFGNVAPEQFEVWRPPEGAECRMSSHVPHAALCRMSQAVLLFSSPTLLPLTHSYAALCRMSPHVPRCRPCSTYDDDC